MQGIVTLLTALLGRPLAILQQRVATGKLIKQ